MVSGVQADPTRNIVEGPAASTDKIAETANGVIEDTADSSCQLRLEGTATQLHQCRSVAGATTMAKAANGVFEDTADAIVVLSEVHSCGKRDGSPVQVVSCGWKAQPHLCTNADLWLVQSTATYLRKRVNSLKHSCTFYAKHPRRIQNGKRQETLF
jgi:hypothetical protein